MHFTGTDSSVACDLLKANMRPQRSHPTLVRILPLRDACYQRYREVPMLCAFYKQQDAKRALAYMCGRFDLNDTFHDVGRMQISCPS